MMRIYRYFYLLLMLMTGYPGLVARAEEIRDPDSTLDPYSMQYRTFLAPLFGKVTLENMEQLKAFSTRRDLSDDVRYTALRTLIMRLDDLTDNVQDVQHYCQIITPREDDYQTLGICRNLSADLSQAEKASMWLDLIEKSRLHFRGTIAPARLALTAVYYILANGDIPRTIDVLQKILDGLPNTATATILSLKFEIARLYGLPNNSPALIERALALYDELEAAWRSDPSRISAADVVAFKKGYLKAGAFHRYQDALDDFSRVGSTYQNEVRIYKAYVHARLGQTKEALSLLQKPLAYGDFVYASQVPFYRCLMEMTKKLSGAPSVLQVCTQIPMEVSYTDQYFIIRELLSWDLDRPVRNALLAQFWTLYKDKIEPGQRLATEQSIQLLELKEARFEAEQQKNLTLLEQKRSQLKNFVIGSSLLFVLALLFLIWRIHLKNRSIEKLQIYIETRVLQRFLPPELVQEILSGQSRLEREAHDCLITVLFSDLVEFTRLTERMGAKASAHILNSYMTEMINVIHAESGTIDKFIGDAVMVLYGAPTALDPATQAQRAVRCAERMLEAMHRLNENWQQIYGVKLAMRIGIHQGMAVVGSFGSEKRSDFTAIGSAVNLAARVEAQAEPNQILLTSALAPFLDARQMQSRGQFALKGFDEAFELFAWCEEPSMHASLVPRSDQEQKVG